VRGNFNMIVKKLMIFIVLAAILLTVSCSASTESTQVETAPMLTSLDELEPAPTEHPPSSSNNSVDVRPRFEEKQSLDTLESKDSKKETTEEAPPIPLSDVEDNPTMVLTTESPAVEQAQVQVQAQAQAPSVSDNIIVPPTYDSIIEQAELQIADLKLSIQGSLFDLYQVYLEETDLATKQDLITQAKARIAQCDAEFESLMTSLESSLTTNGYSSNIIDTYWSSYEEQKSLAEDILS
jgi:hypothetical protein